MSKITLDVVLKTVRFVNPGEPVTLGAEAASAKKTLNIILNQEY
jgi:hypothetical protein